MRTRCGPCINHSVFNIQIPCAATGYTKHYFAGRERLASAIGNGGLADVGHPIVDGLLPSRAHFLVQPHGKITDKSTNDA